MKGFDSFYDKTLMPVIGKINFRVLEELAEFWKGRGVPRYSGDSDLFQYANPWSADMESRVATVMRFKPSTQGIVDKGEVTSTIAELVRERRDQSQKQPSSTGFDRTNPGYGNSGSNPSRDTGSAVFEGSPYNRGSPSVGGSRPYTGQLSLFDDRTPTAPTRGSQAKPNLFLGYQADAGIIYFVILYTDNSMRGDLEDAARSAHLHQEDEHQVLRGTEFGVSGPLSGAMYTVRSESNAYLLDLARRTFPGYNLITEQVSSLQVNLETFDGLNPPEKIELGQFFNRAFGQ
jgi:hypothetical protein